MAHTEWHVKSPVYSERAPMKMCFLVCAAEPLTSGAGGPQIQHTRAFLTGSCRSLNLKLPKPSPHEPQACPTLRTRTIQHSRVTKFVHGTICKGDRPVAYQISHDGVPRDPFANVFAAFRTVARSPKHCEQILHRSRQNGSQRSLCLCRPEWHRRLRTWHTSHR